MKKPKQLNRHCPFCRKHTEFKVTIAKKRGRNQARPMSVGSTHRIVQRGQRRGFGNLGRYSKPTKPKQSGKKLSKKTDFRYECKECKKTHSQPIGIRAKKVEMV
ncbi:MAG: 50S ribosomal protein L44e [Candidatus Woesearchaeota archaeon]